MAAVVGVQPIVSGRKRLLGRRSRLQRAYANLAAFISNHPIIEANRRGRWGPAQAQLAPAGVLRQQLASLIYAAATS